MNAKTTFHFIFIGVCQSLFLNGTVTLHNTKLCGKSLSNDKKTSPKTPWSAPFLRIKTRCKWWQAEKSALSVLSSTDIFKYTCNRNQSDVTLLIEPAHSCVMDAETLNIPPHIPIFSCDLSRFSTKSPRYLLIKSATRDSNTIFLHLLCRGYIRELRGLAAFTS